MILLWSLIIFFTKPKSIYESFKKITFHFWLAFWFAAFFFYLVLSIVNSYSLVGLATILAITDLNSILLLAVYSSYTRAKDFILGGFLRTWAPLFGVLVLWEFLLVAIGRDLDASRQESVRFLMLTPSLGIAMLAAFSLGWGFHRRLGRAAGIFPFVSVLWALIQMPLYIFAFIKHDELMVGRLLWILVFLKMLIGLMFFFYITVPSTSEESVIRPAEPLPFPQSVKKVLMSLLYWVGALLSLIKLFEWLSTSGVVRGISRALTQ